MKEKDNVKQAFSKNKAAYISSSTHAKEEDLNELSTWLKAVPDMNVLDIATGGGHVAKQLSEYVKSVYATDITKEMLENTAQHLQSYTNIHYVIADAENLPFLDNTFTVVTCRIAAHHFPHPDQFIQEVQRVLKPGGQFLFIDNVAPKEDFNDHFINTLEKMRDYSHVRSLKVSEWKSIFQKYGLTIVKNQSRKKTLPYEEWVTRTLDTTEKIDQVGKFISSASSEIQAYYQVKSNHRGIQSFAIDEWMVLSQLNGQ